MDSPSHKKVTEVIFQGVKSFAGVGATLECVLVNHISFGVIEIVANDKQYKLEASRLYVDDSIVRAEMGQDDANITEYLLKRICIAKYFPDSKLIELRVSNNVHEPRFTCSRPSGLKPFVFDEVTAFESSSSAPTQSAAPTEALSSQDRWRIPVIFAKVGKNAPLSANDARIWAAFARGKCEEDVLASVASALSEQLPEDYMVVDDEEQHALQDTIAAGSMPSNTPFPGSNSISHRPTSASSTQSQGEMPGRMVSSRSLSDFSKLDSHSRSSSGRGLHDNEEDAELFAAPPLARTQSYNCSNIGSSPRHSAAVGLNYHRDGEIGPPSPRKNRAPLPRSGTNSKLSSPTAKSGIADLSAPQPQQQGQQKCVQVEVSKPHKDTRDTFEKEGKSAKGRHKRVVSLSVLDSLADALHRGLGLGHGHSHSRDPYVRTDTASTESDLGVERGVSVDECSVGGASVAVSVSSGGSGAGRGTNAGGVCGGTGWNSSGVNNSNTSIAAGTSSKKIPFTPPVSPREALNVPQDPFPPHSDYVTPARRHSYTVPYSGGSGGGSGGGSNPLQVLQAMQQSGPLSPQYAANYSTLHHTSPISNHHSQHTPHTPHTLSPQAQAQAQDSYVAQVPLKTSPQSAYSPVQVSSRSGSVSGSSSGKGSDHTTSNTTAHNEEVQREVRHRRHHSRSPSPSFLRTLASWGGASAGSSSRVVPGSWEDENSF